MAPVVAPPPKPIRKKLVRRTGPDRSQALRRAVQLAFFALNAWIGIGVLPVCPLLRDRRAQHVGRPSPGRRGLAPDRLDDESEGASGQRTDAAPAPRRDVPADRLSRRLLDLPQELLRLAVSGGNRLGVPVAAGTPDLRPQFPTAAQAGRRVAQPEVPAARSVPVRRGLDVRAGDPRFSGRPVRHRGRREDAQLLPLPGPRRAASWSRCW